MRRGFTVVETMVALLVTGIVLTAVMSSFLSSRRMMATVMEESELALAARAIREKLLFRVSPTIDGVHYAGMLSGTNAGWVVESGSGCVVMYMGAVGSTLSDVRQQRMRLLMDGSAADRGFINEWTPDKDRYRGWLRSGGIPLADGAMSDAVSYDAVGNDPSGVYRVNVDVNLVVRDLWKEPAYRRERVSVPLMGRLQPMVDAEGRY
jgi:prepilin-type N-terminal cleavage/methylation domain-containing protein